MADTVGRHNAKERYKCAALLHWLTQPGIDLKPLKSLDKCSILSLRRVGSHISFSGNECQAALNLCTPLSIGSPLVPLCVLTPGKIALKLLDMHRKHSFIYDSKSIGFSRNGKQIDDPIIPRAHGLSPTYWAGRASELCDLLNAHIEPKPYHKLREWHYPADTEQKSRPAACLELVERYYSNHKRVVILCNMCSRVVKLPLYFVLDYTIVWHLLYTSIYTPLRSVGGIVSTGL